MFVILSESINKESGFIEKLKVEESRSILINYMDHGNKLARNEDANLRTYEDLKTNRGESQAIGILNTVSDLTNKVSKLENPTIEGLWNDNRSDEEQIGATYDELEKAMLDESKSESNLSKREKEVMNIYKSFLSAN